jgi:hypothetical protein
MRFPSDSDEVRLLSTTIATALAVTGGSALARAAETRIPVALRLVGDDGLSQDLDFRLEAGLKKDDRLRLATEGDQPTIVIESDSNVDADELDGRTVAIALVYVYAPGKNRGAPIVRACWGNDLRTCAREIIRVAKIRAQSM